MKKINLFALLLCFTSLLFIACKEKAKTITAKDILNDNRDTSLSAGLDFFKYANGLWINNNPIPAEESSWGIGNLVVKENYEKLKVICEESVKSNADKNSPQGMLANFWKTAMDSIKCESLGITPLLKEFQRIDAIHDVNGIIDEIVIHHQYGVNSLMDMYVSNDLINSDKMTLYMSQGGLSLPNRDYYFNNDERTKKIRDAFPGHVIRMLEICGESKENASKAANNILSFETILAHKSRKLEALRDPHANYNVYTKQMLPKLNTKFDWNRWTQGLHLNIDTIIIGQPEFFKEIDNLLTKVDINAWKTYLKWQLIHSFASTLNHAADQENFEFYGKLIRGIEVQKPRWKRSLNAIEGAMGDNLGREYVKYFFGEKEKKRYSDMVENVREVFAEHIKNLDWMSTTTKEKALDKLNKMGKKVGYPDIWRDFSKMAIDTISYFDNSLASRKWWFDNNIQKLGKPVDRTEWDMTPQTYNAYYNPSNNEIVLPAAIFAVPGCKDADLDDALVYGYAAASTIGHEITHGFDDEGRKFNVKGNLEDWWTKEDAAQFKKRADLMVRQFNEFVVLDSMHVNGEATLGENIADLGGVVLGLGAFKKTEQFKKAELKNGMTPLQRYFLGYALGWLGHSRNENLANQILTDVHAPNFLRVNGPFVNVPEFYEAFNITPTDKMYRADSIRVRIW